VRLAAGSHWAFVFGTKGAAAHATAASDKRKKGKRPIEIGLFLVRAVFTAQSWVQYPMRAQAMPRSGCSPRVTYSEPVLASYWVPWCSMKWYWGRALPTDPASASWHSAKAQSCFLARLQGTERSAGRFAHFLRALLDA